RISAFSRNHGRTSGEVRIPFNLDDLLGQSGNDANDNADNDSSHDSDSDSDNKASPAILHRAPKGRSSAASEKPFFY
ncbi:MAG TPA: hypothetical protein PLD88_00905, partial [Candidatus Berkiella sp.]|nr:hypothetical protein [Candidatus Berkiella sp.]